MILGSPYMTSWMVCVCVCVVMSIHLACWVSAYSSCILHSHEECVKIKGTLFMDQ